MLAFAWLAATAAVAVRQKQFIFKPPVLPEVDRPTSVSHHVRSVVLRAHDDTRLSGWLLVPVPGAMKCPGVVYFGGRSEEVSWVVRDAARLFPGMAVLACNYRGYGQSHGIPGEAAMVDDAMMLYDWLAQCPQVDAKQIAVVGRSLGSGIALQVAAARSVKSVVLLTPYDSILAMAQKRFRVLPVSLVLRHRFESTKHALKVTAPVYVLRAETDIVVPADHTDKLMKALGSLQAEETISASNHSTIPYLPLTQAKIAAFLAHNFTFA